jgi:hypothetical protein
MNPLVLLSDISKLEMDLQIMVITLPRIGEIFTPLKKD